MASVTIARLDRALDLPVWQVLGQTAGPTEQTLGLNPGLAEQIAGQRGAVPLGSVVALPDPPSGPAKIATVNLWD